MGRIRYCPTCGRHDAADIAEAMDKYGFFYALCDLCTACTDWYFGVRPFTAKRSGES